MNIPKDQIEAKSYAGECGDGSGIVYVQTKGGLHAFFTKNSDGQVESIAASPHKAISMWMAEKKDPKIKWDSGFMSDGPTAMEKSETALFDRLRETIFCPHVSLSKSSASGSYMVYDWKKAQIQICPLDELFEMIAQKELKGHELVRPSDLSAPAIMLKHLSKGWPNG